MRAHDLLIEIAADGTVTVETRGVKGRRCLHYAEMIEVVLGAASRVERTSEFYEPAEASVRLGVSDGRGE